MKNKQYKYSLTVTLISSAIFILLMVFANYKGKMDLKNNNKTPITTSETNWKNHLNNQQTTSLDTAIIRTGETKINNFIYINNYNVKDYEWNNDEINVIKDTFNLLPEDLKFVILNKGYTVHLVYDCLNKERLEGNYDVCTMAEVDFSKREITVSKKDRDIETIKINFMHEIGHLINNLNGQSTIKDFKEFYNIYIGNEFTDAYNEVNGDYVISDFGETWAQIYSYTMLNRKDRLDEIRNIDLLKSFVDDQNNGVIIMYGWKVYNPYIITEYYIREHS